MGKRLAKPSPRLDELRALAGAPESQAALAVEIVEREKDVRAVRAALDVLIERPTPAARAALLARYAFLADDGVKRDAGTYLRAALLKALRPLARPEDLPLLERAASTYEFLPPTRSEEAGLLRSTALVVMNEVDPGLAGYHAVRLLADPLTSRLSGEPALTAARVLAALDNRWVLYYYALHQAQPPPVSEVLSECLKSLAGLPASLLPGLIEKYRDSADEAVLVGLLDLLLEYEVEAARDFIRGFLRQTRQYAVFRYLVTRLVTGHDARYLGELAPLAQREDDAHRRLILDEALSLGGSDPQVQAALAALHGAAVPRPRQRKAAVDDD